MLTIRKKKVSVFCWIRHRSSLSIQKNAAVSKHILRHHFNFFKWVSSGEHRTVFLNIFDGIIFNQIKWSRRPNHFVNILQQPHSIINQSNKMMPQTTQMYPFDATVSKEGPCSSTVLTAAFYLCSKFIHSQIVFLRKFNNISNRAKRNHFANLMKRYRPSRLWP